MKTFVSALGGVLLTTTTLVPVAAPLGLPEVPVPANNPLPPEKIQLGDKLFHDTRFSATGEVSCATCHDKKKPLPMAH